MFGLFKFIRIMKFELILFLEDLPSHNDKLKMINLISNTKLLN